MANAMPIKPGVLVGKALSLRKVSEGTSDGIVKPKSGILIIF
jgi:hypothetical protein